MSKIVPTISSGLSGPLGVLHLPRFWQKASLDAAGKLHDDYPGCGGGYDQMTVDALGLDKEKTLAYLKESKPTYLQFEAWVKENGSFDEAAVAKHNESVTGYIHDDDTRKEIFDGCGATDDSCAYRDAVNLNNLDDWAIFHAQELS
ncbi:MAG: DUF5069 domain-containing protein [Verrucomicrobiota bacterium]